jgi:hypothetical protein
MPNLASGEIGLSDRLQEEQHLLIVTSRASLSALRQCPPIEGICSSHAGGTIFSGDLTIKDALPENFLQVSATGTPVPNRIRGLRSPVIPYRLTAR